VRLSDTPVRLDHAGPLLGEHTRAVLSRLGVAESEIDDLARSGVLGLQPD
jgi:crotonobetainyl-CoA:carnitine CoA-transferase CaiB-like acyl-CoA transferase